MDVPNAVREIGGMYANALHASPRTRAARPPSGSAARSADATPLSAGMGSTSASPTPPSTTSLALATPLLAACVENDGHELPGLGGTIDTSRIIAPSYTATTSTTTTTSPDSVITPPPTPDWRVAPPTVTIIVTNPSRPRPAPPTGTPPPDTEPVATDPPATEPAPPETKESRSPTSIGGTQTTTSPQTNPPPPVSEVDAGRSVGVTSPSVATIGGGADG